MPDQQIVRQGLPKDVFGLGLSGSAFPAFTIRIVLFGRLRTSVGEEDNTQRDHQDPNKKTYGYATRHVNAFS
jgi:hypothetical protein